jgi:hypothetical protein
MGQDSDQNLRLEIGHVLFIDLVSYSELLIVAVTCGLDVGRAAVHLRVVDRSVKFAHGKVLGHRVDRVLFLDGLEDRSHVLGAHRRTDGSRIAGGKNPSRRFGRGQAIQHLSWDPARQSVGALPRSGIAEIAAAALGARLFGGLFAGLSR